MTGGAGELPAGDVPPQPDLGAMLTSHHPVTSKRAPAMPLFRVEGDKLEALPSTSFMTERMLERRDLQRLLKADITPLGDDLMVLSEEFGDWEDSSRRIDLLCLDRDARLVIVEIKRTQDGGHMDLQAVRYAAMVSNMTIEQAIHAHARSLGNEDARAQAEERS
jgi:hypothetical protein